MKVTSPANIITTCLIMVLLLLAFGSCEYLGLVDEGDRHPYDPASDDGGDDNNNDVPEPQWNIVTIQNDMGDESYEALDMVFAQNSNDFFISYEYLYDYYAVRWNDDMQQWNSHYFDPPPEGKATLALNGIDGSIYFAVKNFYDAIFYVYSSGIWSSEITVEISTEWSDMSTLCGSIDGIWPMLFFYLDGNSLKVNGPDTISTPFGSGLVDGNLPGNGPEILAIDAVYDPNGIAHIAYIVENTDTGDIMIRHAYQSGTGSESWIVEPYINQPAIIDDFMDTDISIAATQDTVHIIYLAESADLDDILVYVWRDNSGTWQYDNSMINVIRPANDYFSFSTSGSIVVDTAGEPNVLFCADDRVRYARLIDNSWHIWDVEHGDSSRSRPVMRIDRNGQVHAAYLGTGPNGTDALALRHAALVAN
ncbi:MAG: hypothetical protein JW874_05650 [Spirochaetales bacterium]|nr:hypothetical protein [Spirochaetales bacterium]